MKVCNNPKCFFKGISMSLDNFNNNKSSKDGKTNRCKLCVRKSVIESTNKNPEYYRQDSIKRSRLDRKLNPEKWKKIGRERNQIYLENGYYKKYYQKNRERLIEYEKRDDVKERRNKRWRERYKTDTKFRLKELMTSNFHLFFKDRGRRKNLSFTKVIDYDYEELKTYIESHFRKGMTWNNFGELWEIHHIKPQNMFSLDDEDEIKECWRLNNLFPLWKTTEISHQMGDTLIGNRNVSKTDIYNPLEYPE